MKARDLKQHSAAYRGIETFANTALHVHTAQTQTQNEGIGWAGAGLMFVAFVVVSVVLIALTW